MLLQLTSVSEHFLTSNHSNNRGGEWYLERRGSRKILTGSRNLGSVFDKSRSLVFAWFVFTFFESRNFIPKSLGLGFLTRVSASRRVSDFTIRHPWRSYAFDSYWKLKNGRNSFRKAREAHLIHKAKTFEPLGINKPDEL